MSIAIFKRGKGIYGKDLTKIRPEDLYLLNIPRTTAELINNGEDGKSTYLTIADLLLNGRGIISGAGIVWVSGYKFQIPAHKYAIRGTVYEAPATEIVLDDADPTDNRIDVIVGTFDTQGNGVFQVVKGTTAPVAVKPSINENTQIEITFVPVDAATTQPVSLNNLIIYNENTEFTTSAIGTVNFDAVTDPGTDVKCIDVTGFTDGHEISFVGTPFNPLDYTGFVFQIHPTSGKWINNSIIKLAFYNGTTKVSDTIVLDSTYNNPSGNTIAFDSQNDTWQVVSLLNNTLNIVGNTIDTLKIWKDDGRGAVDFKLDFLRFQSGISVVTPPVVITRTSQLINDGESGNGKYVEEIDLATVAFSGDYYDLTNLPSLYVENLFKLSGHKINNYELSQDNNLPYRNAGFIENVGPMVNDASLGGFHGFRYVQKHDSLFATDRSTGASTYLRKFDNLNSIDEHYSVDLKQSGFFYSDQLIYSSYKDRLYVVMSDGVNWTQTIIKVLEINPVDLSVTNVINYNIGSLVGVPVLITLDNHLYVATGYYNPKVVKFNLDTYVYVNQLTISDPNNGAHAIVTDGTKLYVTSTWNSANQFVVRIDPVTMQIEQTLNWTFPYSGSVSGISDDILLVGDYLYLPLEGFTTDNYLFKVKCSDLTINNLIKIENNGAGSLWTVYYDGTDIWYAGTNKCLGKFNPETGENYLYESPFIYNINEIQSDGQRLFVAGFDVYPVNNTGFYGAMMFPDKPIKKSILNSAGERVYTLDYTTGLVTVPISTIANIDLSGDKTLVTKEYLNNSISTSDITHADLLTAITNSTLIPGKKYRITDYQTVHTIPNTADTNTAPIEVLIATAIKTNELAPIVYSESFPDDVIYYDPQNNQTMVAGCTKGYIYRRIDTIKNNDIGFDFRNVKFRRWEITATDWSSATTYAKGNVVKKVATNEIYISLRSSNTNNDVSNTTWWKRFEWNVGDYIGVTANWIIIPSVLTIPTTSNYMDYHLFTTDATISGVQANYDTDAIYNNQFKGNKDNLISNSNTVIFGYNNHTNIVDRLFYNNSIKDNFKHNVIGMDFSYNSIGYYFQNNSIEHYWYRNSIGHNFIYNSFITNFYRNVVSSDFTYNTVKRDFYRNFIGTNCANNSIGNYFNNNTIGNNFGSNFVETGIASIDFSSATLVYTSYHKKFFKRSDGQVRLSYYDANDNLVVTSPTT